MTTLYRWFLSHKIVSAVLIVILAWGGFRLFLSGTPEQLRYVLGSVRKQTLTISVSGVGQISSSEQIDVKPKVSSDVTLVRVVAGQEVKAGQVMVYLNARNASQTVQNARVALENARITLRKLQQNQTVDSGTAQEDLSRAYEDALNAITDTFLSLPDIMSDAFAVSFGGMLGSADMPNSSDYVTMVSEDRFESFKKMVVQSKSDYREAEAAYDPAFDAYRAMRRDATPQQIAVMLDKSVDVVGLVVQALVSERNMLDTLTSDINGQPSRAHVQVPAHVTAALPALSDIINTANSLSNQLTTASRTIGTAVQNLANSQLSDPLDMASQLNTVKQREADLQHALADLGDYTVRSPLSGTVAKVNVKKGDSASSGTAVATIISHQQIVNLSLNEVDVAKMKIGQKSTLTFDAISDLAMTGTVEQVDSIGTTDQGVVSYNVTIALDTQDERIRPGMSVSTAVIVDVRQDALVVPVAAVKSQGDASYVEVPDGEVPTSDTAAIGVILVSQPQRVSVTVGVSDDTSVEILSGLTEGQDIIARTITAATSQSAQTTQNRQGSIIPGVGGGGGGTRFIR